MKLVGRFLRKFGISENGVSACPERGWRAQMIRADNLQGGGCCGRLISSESWSPCGARTVVLAPPPAAD